MLSNTSNNMYKARFGVVFDFGVAFDLEVAFVFCSSDCVAAVCEVQKMEKEEPLSEV